MAGFTKRIGWVVGLGLVILLDGQGSGSNALAQKGTPADAVKKEKPPIHILVAKVTGNEKALVKRLGKLNFKVTLLEWERVDPDRFQQIDVILLPTQWAELPQHFNHFESKQKAFHDFVKRGGGLLVCQPNPLHAPQQKCTPTLLPYPITFLNFYNATDPTRLNLDPMHFITNDLPGNDLPFPFDPMIKVDPRYKVLAEQKSTGFGSLAVCSFGDGRVVVQTANENIGTDLKLGDEILRRMVVWAAGREPAKGKPKP